MEFIDDLLAYITKKINTINTTELGIVTAVYPETMKCDIKLKSTVNGLPFDLKLVPISYPNFGGSTIIILPEIGDLVVVNYTRRPLKEQIRIRTIQNDINESVLYDINNAIVVGGLYSNADTKPTVSQKQILIHHTSGSSFKIMPDGTIALYAKDGDTQMTLSPDNIMIQTPGTVTINAGNVLITTGRMDVNQGPRTMIAERE